MALNFTDINDMSIATLRGFKKDQLAVLANKYPKYEFCKQILANDKVSWGGGLDIQRQLQLDENYSAEHVGLYQTRKRNQNNTLTKVNVPIRYTQAYIVYDQREIMAQRSDKMIVNYLKAKKNGAWMSLYNLLEIAGWSKPSSSSDSSTPYGIPTWITMWPTGTATAGFNGGNANGFSSGVGGVDRSTVTQAKNFTSRYVNITAADFVASMREAILRCDFQSPLDDSEASENSYRYYSCLSAYKGLELFAEQRNENLGFQIASGALMVNRQPVRYVARLDDSYGRFYGVCYDGFEVEVDPNLYFYMSEPMADPNQPFVYTIYVTLGWNTVATDVRRSFCLSLLSETGTTT